MSQVREEKVEITNRYGLHGRPTTMFVTIAQRFRSSVVVSRDGSAEEVDGKSAIGLLSLGMERGSVMRIRVQGDDADETVEALLALVRANFNEE
ncbi:MAG: HPr family phosphocarrier protein [Planctomycetes bacterium]|nr:HPr family phosphocarrier protein [Planctomycetota bacterium]